MTATKIDENLGIVFGQGTQKWWCETAYCGFKTSTLGI